MTVPNDTVENENRVTDNLDVSVLSREDGVFEVTNLSHDDPSEHEYKVFCDEGDAYHCECPAFEFGNGLDDEGRCKHMRVAEQFVAHLHFRDWQQVQKEREEEERKQAMVEKQEEMFRNGTLEREEVRDGLVSAIVTAAFDDDCDMVNFEEEEQAEQDSDDEVGDLPDFDEYMEQTTIERAIEESSRDDGPTTAEDVLESAKAAVEAYESVEEQAKETREEMPSKDEWRSMSNEGRKRLSAWV